METSIVELTADHPGFNDPAYRSRRNHIANIANAHEAGTLPPRIAYNDTERATWRAAFDQLMQLYPTGACKEFAPVVQEMDYTPDKIPQIADVSAFLQKRTGFRLEPVAGLVNARDFLTALSRGTFCTTQYIRHHSKPHYTPEPDIIHELMGHVPMLAIDDFARLSKKIGEGAEHASEKQIQQLATLYWFTVEYGLVRQDGTLRAYGAGLLSSFGELKHVLAGKSEVRKFEPEVAKDYMYPITTYQPLLCEVSSIREAFDIMDAFVRKHILSQPNHELRFG